MIITLPDGQTINSDSVGTISRDPGTTRAIIHLRDGGTTSVETFSADPVRTITRLLDATTPEVVNGL